MEFNIETCKKAIVEGNIEILKQNSLHLQSSWVCSFAAKKEN